MDWESLYGTTAQYEARLREVERENYAQRVWASTHPRRSWRDIAWFQWLKALVTRQDPRPASYDARFGQLTIAAPKQEG